MLTKTIVNVLKLILPKVTLNQYSFVLGHQITNVVIVQEVLHFMRRRRVRKGMMVQKLNLEKAYNRIRWAFALGTLRELKLPYHMVSMIMKCITTSSMRVSWKGEVIGSFLPFWGIW